MPESPSESNNENKSKVANDKRQGTPCKRRRIGSEKLFPGKLHDLLNFAEREGLEGVIAWSEDGRAFYIYNPKELLKVLPLFFGHTKYRSFQRQLNMWSFIREMEGKDRGAFSHPFFQKGQKSILKTISREKFRDPPSDRKKGRVEVDEARSDEDSDHSEDSLMKPDATASYPKTLSGRVPMTKRNSAKAFRDFLLPFETFGGLQDGDVVDFAGKHFHFVDFFEV